jgi:RHS repeat-associated protein
VGLQPGDSLVDHFVADVLSVEDYYPFGMGMPGRRTNADTTGYRYGFNGKEDDRETGWQDYGMRVYRPGLGRFLSVDPLTYSFPFYAPYQFAGNTPIQFIDLDGGEPKSKTSTNSEVRKLFVTPGENYAGRLLFIHGPYWVTGGDNAYFSTSETQSKGYYETSVDANKFIGYKGQINKSSQFFRNDESYSESQLINNLLGDFIWGNRPENTVFKHNGKYSNLMKESVAVGETLAKFSYDMETGSSEGISQTYSWANDARGEVNVNAASGPFSLAHFVGSCQLRVTSFSNTDEIMVEIFNVTSLTSGDFIKDITPDFLVKPLKSTVRNGNNNKSQTEYSNTSQYFSFTMSRKEFNAKVKQYHWRPNIVRTFSIGYHFVL